LRYCCSDASAPSAASAASKYSFSHEAWNTVFPQFPISVSEHFTSFAALADYVAARVLASPIVRRDHYYPHRTDQAAAAERAQRTEQAEPVSERTEQAEQPTLSAYELERQARIRHHATVFQQLGLDNASAGLTGLTGLSGLAGLAHSDAPDTDAQREAPAGVAPRWDARLADLVALQATPQRDSPLGAWAAKQLARFHSLSKSQQASLSALPFWHDLHATLSMPHYNLRGGGQAPHAPLLGAKPPQAPH
jgi:hypothetical protein